MLLRHFQNDRQHMLHSMTEMKASKKAATQHIELYVLWLPSCQLLVTDDGHNSRKHWANVTLHHMAELMTTALRAC